jgi:hypothetical protein
MALTPEQERLRDAAKRLQAARHGKDKAKFNAALIDYENHATTAAILDLLALVKKLQRDAARYQWLRDSPDSTSPFTADGACWVVKYHHKPGTIPLLQSGGKGSLLDANVDFAMATAPLTLPLPPEKLQGEVKP